MNSTTIQFLQENPTSQSNTYSWSPMDNHLHIPIQQITYVEPNLTLINSTKSSMSFIQMSHSETLNHSDQNATNDDQVAYFAPLINIALNEQTKSDKVLPTIAIEQMDSDNNQQITYYDHHSSNSTLLPSMAASFGSPVFVKSNTMNESSVQSVQNKSITHTLNQINVNQALNGVKSAKLKSNVKSSDKIDWANNNSSKPGRRAKNNSKVKNERLNNLSRDMKNVDPNLKRKHISNQIANRINQEIQGNLQSELINEPFNKIKNKRNVKNTINLSEPANNLCNLNPTCSSNLNKSIDSTNSTNSLNSFDSFIVSNNKSKGKDGSNLPESVKRRNFRERMRVKQVNMGFDNLRAKLPNSKKMSKVQTLRYAAQYIKDLLQLLHGPSYNVNLQSTSISRNHHKSFKHLESNTPHQAIEYYDIDSY